MDKTEKFWDKLAKKFDKGEKRFKEIHNKTIMNTKKYLKSNDAVLDYGCATGIKSFEISKNVSKIVGIDISSKMIDEAKRKAKEYEIKNIDFIHLKIFDDKLQKESFDVILAFNILHLIKENQQVIKRINDLLKQGGSFITATPCLKEKMSSIVKIQITFYNLISKAGLIPIRMKFYSRSELESLLTTNNFKIIEAENIYQKLTNCFIAAKKM